MDSIYFQALVSEIDHPLLHDFLAREYANADRVRGLAKKFVCDAAEQALKRQEKQVEETQEHRELMQQLEEIRRLLESGKVFVAGEQSEPAKHSAKVSEKLRKLGM